MEEEGEACHVPDELQEIGLPVFERVAHHRDEITIEGGLLPHRLGFLREGERCWFVALGEIQRIVVDGNYAQVWFGGQRALLPRSLSALEERLDPALFFRANRHTLINLRMVQGVEPAVGDGYVLTLRDGSEVELSRRQAREFRERMAL